MRRRQRFAAVIPACVRLSRSGALAAAIFYTYASESRRRSPTCTPERSAACRLLHLLQLGSRDDALRGRRDDEYLVVFSPRAVAAGVVAIIHLEECAAAARRRILPAAVLLVRLEPRALSNRDYRDSGCERVLAVPVRANPGLRAAGGGSGDSDRDLSSRADESPLQHRHDLRRSVFLLLLCGAGLLGPHPPGRWNARASRNSGVTGALPGRAGFQRDGGDAADRARGV